MKSNTKYHHYSNTEVLEKLKTSLLGLSEKETKFRLEKFGDNALPKSKKFSAIALFFSQFKNPLIYILFFALIISAITKHQADAWIIFIVIMLSTAVGFIQEYKANTALTQLKQLIKYKVKVIRAGHEKIINLEHLVPGDLILLRPGDKVPADARLIECQNLEVIEAALTGESLPIKKNINILDELTPMADQKNMVFWGTVITQGSATAIVTATGIHTQIGQIATMIRETEEDATPLQKQILIFGKTIGIILIVLNVVIFGLGILMGTPLFEMFSTSVAMVVAAIPEGLLPAMTIILAVGMKRLSNQKGLVRKMLATETLGSVSVICSDKTGTLTQGEMRVAEIITETKKLSHDGNIFSETIILDGKASHLTALNIGLLCNNAIIENPNDEPHSWNIFGNPTEKALLLAGRAAGIHKELLEKTEPRVAEIPFQSEHKFMVTKHAIGENSFASYMKGAPEKVLQFATFVDIEGKIQPLSQKKKQEIKTQYEELTATGLRVIATAYKKENSPELDIKNLQDYVFVGLIALKDPLRPEAKRTIELCQQAGIRPIIITGDHKLTTMAIVKDLGLPVTEDNVMEGNDLDKLSDQELHQVIDNITIFARVEPKHKIRIVAALQANGEIVAMTGDGVNDAPALKKSDIGVAVGSGTDVAKETADLVLLDDNFKTIVEAIKRGRGIFDNIRKVILYLLSNSFTEVILISFSLILGLPLALLPVQILWIKMIEDSLPSIALAFEPVNNDVMNRPPRNPKEAIFNPNLKKLLVFVIVMSDLFLFSIFYYFWKTSGDIAYAQTIAFVGLGIASRFYIFSIRNLSKPIYTYNPFQNKLVNLSTIFGFLMIAIAVYVPFLNNILHTVPLGITEWIALGTYAAVSLIIYELGKRLFLIKKV